MEEIEFELTGITKNFSVTIADENLVVVATYMEDKNSMTPEWDFSVVEGDEEDLTEELKDKIISKINDEQ